MRTARSCWSRSSRTLLLVPQAMHEQIARCIGTQRTPHVLTDRELVATSHNRALAHIPPNTPTDS